MLVARHSDVTNDEHGEPIIIMNTHGPYGAPPPNYAPQQYYYPQPPPPMVYVQQTTAFIKAPFSHGVHIVLDVLSCGAWLPIHLICWALH